MKLNLNKSVIKGSFLLLIAFNVYNALNFIFQAYMARKLGLADFSIYGPLSALIYLLAVITDSSQTVLAKYTSGSIAEGKVKNILKRALWKSFRSATLLFLAYVVIAIPLSQLLRVPLSLMILTGALIFTSFAIPVGRGALQGRQRFFALGFNTVGEAVVKIVLGALFVSIGWKVYGVIGAIVLSVVIAFVLSLLQLRKTFRSNEERAELPNLYSYSFPTFVVLLCIASFYVIDLLIARAVFPDEIAGLYAVLALLGKAIFWGSQPISKALFPISANVKEEHTKKRNEFSTALLLLFSCLLPAIILFWIAPDLLIYLLSGVKGTLGTHALIIVGLSFALISIANLTLMYKLSLGRTKNYWVIGIPLILELGILYYLGLNYSLVEFSYGLLLSAALFMLAAIISLRE